MLGIDSQFFPHIIDLIWSYLDDDGLRVVSAASKSCAARTKKVKADLKHSNHLVITRVDSDEVIIRARSFKHCGTVVITEEARECEARRWDSDHDRDSCRFRTRLANLPVLDVVGYTPSVLSRFEFPFDLFEDIGTIVRLPRDLAEQGGFWSLPTFSSKWVFFFSYYGTNTLNLPINFRALDTFDLTINIDCHCSPTATKYTYYRPTNLYELDGNGHLTFVFHHQTPETYRESEPEPDPLFIVALLDNYPEYGITVTLVGLDDFWKSTEALEMFKAAVYQGHVGYRREVKGADPAGLWDGSREDFDELVAFLSHKQYRDQVGEESYKIHTFR